MANRKTRDQLEDELAEFKETVKTVTLEWPAGCESGKRQFLRKVGLHNGPDLTGEYEFVVRFTATDENLEEFLENEDNMTVEQLCAAILEYEIGDIVAIFGTKPPKHLDISEVRKVD